jgi:hypothetical protein
MRTPSILKLVLCGSVHHGSCTDASALSFLPAQSNPPLADPRNGSAVDASLAPSVSLSTVPDALLASFVAQTERNIPEAPDRVLKPCRINLA